MKKRLSIISVILLFLLTVICAVSFSACGNTQAEAGKGGTGIGGIEKGFENGDHKDDDSLRKLDQKIKIANDFSEGLAYVLTEAHQGYFINKNGKIVIDLGNNGTLAMIHFVNGFAVIDQKGSVCDKNGNITTPESVGAAYFYDDALEGGYLLAHVIEANYAGTVNKLGVLDLEFNWLVEATEENYNLLADNLGDSRNYYYNDYLYIYGLQQFLFIKDFTLHEEWEYDAIPETWNLWGSGNVMPKYIHRAGDYSDEPRLDISGIPNLSGNTSFIGENAVVVFYNESAKQAFFTLIDAEGNFAFEPVKVLDGENISWIDYDGEYIVLCGRNQYKSYDKTGKLLGEMKRTNMFITPSQGDGVVCIDNKYYNIDLTPLF